MCYQKYILIYSPYYGLSIDIFLGYNFFSSYYIIVIFTKYEKNSLFKRINC